MKESKESKKVEKGESKKHEMGKGEQHGCCVRADHSTKRKAC